MSVRFTVSPIENADGEQTILFIGIDLSDRRALEESRLLQARLAMRVEQLEAEERELRLIAEAVDAAMLSADVGGVRDMLARVLRRVYPDACVSIYVPHGEVLTLDRVASDEESPPSIDADQCWALRSSRPHLSAPGQVLPECAHMEGEIGVCVPIDAAGVRYGLVVVEVSPTGSGHTCSACGRADESQRREGRWECTCGAKLPVEVNTARVLAQRVGTALAERADARARLAELMIRVEERGLGGKIVEQGRKALAAEHSTPKSQLLAQLERLLAPTPEEG
jgi:hypothetical protein